MGFSIKLKKGLFKSKLKFESRISNFNSLELAIDLLNKKSRDNQDYMDNREIIYVSPSMLSCDCDRVIQYRLLNAVPKPMSMARVIRICEAGEDLHKRHQRYFRDLNAIWGGWVCQACEATWIGRVGLCPECKSLPYKHNYKEVTLFDDEMQLKGKPDGVIFFRNGKKAVIDFKGIQIKDFWSLKDEYTKYQYYIQLSIYGALLDVPYGCLLYEDRDGSRLKPFFFPIDVNILKEQRRRVKIIRNMIKRKILLPRPEEADKKSCEYCKWCDYSEFCWGVLKGQRKCEPLTFRQVDRRNRKMVQNCL